MIETNNSKKLSSLFIECFILSMVTFGGGSTIIALLQKKIVEKLKWIEESEMLEMLALAQSTPGATSVSVAMLIGYRLFGIKGAMVSAVATALPPLIVITIITIFYDSIRTSEIAANILRGVRACAAALVISVSLTLSINLLKKKDYFTIVVWIFAVLAATVFRVNVLIIILSGLAIGIMRSLLLIRREGR